jgi:S-adenosylmethionine hydrolase
MSKCNLQVGKTYQVTVTKNNKTYFAGKLQYGHSFADVPSQTDVMFFDSIDTIAFATNLGNFAKKYNIGFGFEWEIKIATV